MRFWRKCPCVFSADQDILRFVDIVTKEGATPPEFGASRPEEWAKLNCPQCHGTGRIEEIAEQLTPAQEEALLRDFRNRMVVKG